MNTIVIKVTTKSGNFWTTSFNGTIETATDYFLNRLKWYITEDDLTGKETRDRIISVHLVQS
jgi:hypothetical protein